MLDFGDAPNRNLVVFLDLAPVVYIPPLARALGDGFQAAVHRRHYHHPH
jgi:hypothetical protein